MKHPTSAAWLSLLFGHLSSAAQPERTTDYAMYNHVLPAASISETENLWAGAIIDKENYDGVVGTIKVPSMVKVPSGSDAGATNCMTMWVGVGGTCDRMLQAGITACIKDGGLIYRSWFAWNPYYSGRALDIRAGDEIQMTISNGSTVEMKNLGTGQTGGVKLDLEYPLCENKAQWMVQPYTSEYPLADFGTVGFTDAYATLGENKFDITDATLFEIKEGNKQVTTSKYTGNTVTVEYTG
jgi:hypothetical protein